MYQITLEGELIRGDKVNPVHSEIGEVCSVCEGTAEGIDFNWTCCPCEGLQECPSCCGGGQIEIAVKSFCEACDGEGTREAELAVEEQQRIRRLVRARYPVKLPKSIVDWWK